MSDSEERDSDMGSSDAEEDSGEDSGEESGEEGSQSAAASEPNPRSLVLDAGARMEMLLHRLRSAHLDALTRVAYGEVAPRVSGVETSHGGRRAQFALRPDKANLRARRPAS